jgi:L-threonylcarbamoyladenylate synthase
LDGGPCPIGLESTVLDLTAEIPTILRPGGTPAEALQEMIPELVISSAVAIREDQKSKLSPGMMLKHYSPRAKFLLFKGGRNNAAARIRQIVEQLINQGYRVGLMLTEEDILEFNGLPVEIENLGSREDLAGIGKSLFAKMRTLDKQGVDYILMRSLSSKGLGLAISDRLFKAAEQQVIDLDSIRNLPEIFSRN